MSRQTHVVCCDPDLATCGTEVPGDGFAPDDTPVSCPLCAIAWDNQLPCDAPSCPYRAPGELPAAPNPGVHQQ